MDHVGEPGGMNNMALDWFGEQHDVLLPLCRDLVSCVEKIMDPSSAQHERAEYNQKIEQFKEESPHCLRCGFILTGEQSPIIRHFGLQLMEHFIKYHWSTLSLEEGKQTQLHLLQMLSDRILLPEQEQVFVKEALARVTVEIAKQMWPQRWENFFSDLDTLSNRGPAQVELVLLIFRRLAEEIHMYESNVTTVRRREMAAALNEHLENVFSYLVRNLETPLSESLRQTALSTIASFVEWVEFEVILMDEAKLIKLLYTLISVEELKTAACECLLPILSRKGDIRKTEGDRTTILSLLLSSEALNGILTASVRANSQGVVEEQYVFLKRVCQVLVHLGSSQLALLWTYSPSFKPPEALGLYLQVVVEFTKHDSQLLSLTSTEVWLTLLSHNYAKDHPVFKDFLPHLLTIARQKLFKLGDPESWNHISSEYSRLDFDGTDEFTLFFATFRGKIAKIVSHVTMLMPRTTAREILMATEETVQKKVEPGQDCSKSSMLYIEWDGLMAFLECWTGTLKSNTELLTIQEVIDTSMAVLRQLLSYETTHPLLLYLQFRCLQTGLLVIDKDQAVLEALLQKIFSCVGFLGSSSNKYHLPRDVVTTRNQITTSFVRLCEAQPALLALQENMFCLSKLHIPEPHVEQLFSEHYQLLLKNDVLVYAEKCNFTESFFILSQKIHSAEQQSVFLGQLLEEPKSLLPDLQSAVSSVSSLITYLGLDKDPSDTSYQVLHRYKLCFIVHIVLLTLKRSSPAPTGTPPSYSHILPFVAKFILPLLGCIYQLWSEESQKLFSEFFKPLRELHQFEKDTILGRTMLRRSDTEEYGELGNVRMNVASAHEGCVASLSRCFVVYGFQRLAEVGLVQPTVDAIMGYIQHLNLLRLRVLIRSLLIPLVSAVIKSDEQNWKAVLLPLFSPIAHFIFMKLKTCWELIIQRKSTTNKGDSTVETEEILDEQVTILLSREFFHLLDIMCIKRTYTSSKTKSKLNDDVIMEEEMTGDPLTGGQAGSSNDPWSSVESLTPLAEQLLQIPETCELLFVASFSGLTWSDSQSANKCVSIAGVIFSKTPTTVFPSRVYEQFFTQTLRALNIHGNLAHSKVQLSLLAMLIYEATVKSCPGLQEIIAQVPNVKTEELQSFNSMLCKNPPASFKSRKEAFRSLISGAVGKHIGEVFKRPVTFDLPEMQFKRRAKKGGSEIDVPNLTSLFGNND